MKMSESIVNLTKAQIQVQQHLKNLPKDKKGEGNYEYVSLSAITNALRYALPQAGLACFQFPEGVQNWAESGMVAITTLLSHESGEYIESTMWIPIIESKFIKSSVQKLGATISYGKRYGLTSMFMIAEEGDDQIEIAKERPVNQSENVAQTRGFQLQRPKDASIINSAEHGEKLEQLIALIRLSSVPEETMASILNKCNVDKIQYLSESQADRWIGIIEKSMSNRNKLSAG